MARPCTVCADPRRADIDRRLLDPSATLQNLAQAYGLSTFALCRHRRQHLAYRELVKEASTQYAETLAGELRSHLGGAEAILRHVLDLHGRAMAIADAHEGADPRTALQALREARGCVELVLRLFLETRPPPTEMDSSAAVLKMLPPDVRQAVLVLSQADGSAADICGPTVLPLDDP